MIFKHVSLNFSVVDCGFEIEAMDCSSCPQFENWCNSTDCGWIDGKYKGKQNQKHIWFTILNLSMIVDRGVLVSEMSTLLIKPI